MNFTLVVLLFILNLANIFSLKNFTGTNEEKCVTCICYAVTMCDNKTICVADSNVNKDYWENAGSPVIKGLPNDESFQECLNDDNCITNTINAYTEAESIARDPNCDGRVDCKDRLAVHFYHINNNSYNLKKYQLIRFDHCANKLKIPNYEGWTPCKQDIIDAVSV